MRPSCRALFFFFFLPRAAFLFFFFCNPLMNLSCTFCRIFSSMSSSSHKNDDGVPPLYCQGGSLSKVGYFKAAHFKINSDDSFRDFLETYWHAIRSRVHVKRVKDGSSREPCDGARRAIKFHPYYFVLGFTFPMPRFFREVLCSLKCAPVQCSPNAIRVMVGFHNLSQFFDLGLTTNEFRYFFKIGRIDGVGHLRSHHRLFDNSSKGDHDWANETLEISGEWESDHSPKVRVPTVFISGKQAALIFSWLLDFNAKLLFNFLIVFRCLCRLGIWLNSQGLPRREENACCSEYPL